MKEGCICLILLTSIIASSTIASTATISLIADEWPPFNIKPGSDREGYIVDIARKIFEAQGYTVVYTNQPWKRAVEMTRAGRYDGAIGASKTDAAGFIFPSEELARNKLAFYVKKGSGWQYKGPSSIAATTIGTIAGYDYRPWLLEYIEANSCYFCPPAMRKDMLVFHREALQPIVEMVAS